jgi:type II secretory pathway component PulF
MESRGKGMADEVIIKLLEEIRDIQKEDLALRKRSEARLRFYPFVLVTFLAVILIWLIFFSAKG